MTLDGSKSWSAAGKVAAYEWQFTDGSTAAGPRVERSYQKPGRYAEVLKVTDESGAAAYDFAIVLVVIAIIRSGACLRSTPITRRHSTFIPAIR